MANYINFELSAFVWPAGRQSISYEDLPNIVDRQYGRFPSLKTAYAGCLEAFPKPKFQGHELRIREGNDNYALAASNAEETFHLNGLFNSEADALAACKQLFPEPEYRNHRVTRGENLSHAPWPEGHKR